MSMLSKIKELKEKRYESFDTREELDLIANEMEDLIGAAGMWSTLRPGLELDEYIENLEYIARENNL